jgi:hypothetical protein
MNQQEKQKQEFHKIKLKIEQPQIICEGRKRVVCFYNGKVVNETECYFLVEFKSFRKKVLVEFTKPETVFCNFTEIKCVTEGWEDLIIVK